MAWRIVKQPNGLLARFSDVVDDFTHMNMTEEEAFHVCHRELGYDDAKKKVQAGIEDWKPWTWGVMGSGHDRWDESMSKIRNVHGDEIAAQREKDLLGQKGDFMHHVASISTGLSSALAAERVMNRYGKENFTGVFMDTLMEHVDNYRFLEDCKARWGIPVTVLTEGRTPYEVAQTQRIIPNQKIAPCTFALKIELFAAWLETQEKPITVHIGYDEINDAHRFKATREKYEALGYSVDFPLTWKPIEYRRYTQVVREDWGIEPPLMYELGYTHANCDGKCVKQGQGDWIRTLIYDPDGYAWVENWEQNMQTLSEKHAGFALLRDQTGGQVKPLTLKELRERHESQPQNPIKLDFSAPCVVCGVGA